MSRLTQKVKVQPTIPQGAVDFYTLNFQKPTGAMGEVLSRVSEFCDKHPGQSFFETPLDCLTHALGMHRALMFQGRRLLKGCFTQGELTACISVMNATALTNSMPGETLMGNIEDVYQSELPVDTPIDMLREKIRYLGIFERAYLELWAWAFWYAPGFDDRKLEEYVKQLVE